MVKVKALVVGLACAGIPLLSACEPVPVPPPERVQLHFGAVEGTPLTYSTDPDMSLVMVDGPDAADPEVCHPAVVSNTLTYEEAVPPGYSFPVFVATGGELLVEVDDLPQCWRRDSGDDQPEQSIYTVYFGGTRGDVPNAAAFDPVTPGLADLRSFIVVK